MDCPGDTVLKNPLGNAEDIGDPGLILGSGRAPGGGHGNLFQYSFFFLIFVLIILIEG